MVTAKQTARVFGLSTVQVKTCAQCGKRFSIVSPDYAYKLEGRKGAKQYRWFCSYACMRKVQKPLEEEQKARFNERVSKDLFGLEESEKHNQRTLAAYHAKKQAQEAAMTEEERAAREARLTEMKRLAGQESAKRRREREAAGAMVDRMRKADEERKKKRNAKRDKPGAVGAGGLKEEDGSDEMQMV